MTWVMWSLVLVRREPVSVQDRCTICAKHTIGSEIILDAPDGNPRDVGQVESRFGLFGASVGAR